MKLSSITTAGLLIAATSIAVALPTFVKEFETTYKINKDSKLGKAGCTVCHVGKGPKLNSYGTDIKKELTAAKTKKVSAEILKKVENLDSDGDGVKNIDEIKADSLPGDPAVTPAKG